jgi:signal transduction histidine kinase/BarA-like signal transduction histidine kinase
MLRGIFQTVFSPAEQKKNGLLRLKLFALASLINYIFSGVYSLLSHQMTTFWFMVAAAVCVLVALWIGTKFSLAAGQVIIVFFLNANVFLFCYNAGLMGISFIFFYPILIASVFLVGFDKFNWQVAFMIICTTVFLALTMQLASEMPKFELPVETILANRSINVWIVYILLVLFVLVFIYLKIRNDKKLNDATQKAQEAAQAKTQFLSVMSHELRTPLNGITGISHLLQTAESEEKKAEYLQLLNKSADHMMRMVGDILDYNKMDSNRLELQQQHFELNEFFDDLYQQFRQQFEQKGLYLQAEQALFRDEITVTGDDIRLAQVLYNLLGNALKFTRQGGAVFSMTAKETRKHAEITFSVSDTGVGIDDEDKQLIFEDFHQGKVTKRHKLGGTGLGLSISKQILHLMNSTLHVNSETGKGSRFYFTVMLPLSNDKAITTQKENDTKDFTHRTTRILVVEDNQVNAVVAASILKKWNVTADTVKNGKEAIEQLDKHAYDLILMDLEMPVMDGFAATAAIRSKNISIPIVALTAALMEKQTMQKLQEVGFSDTVSKPFNPEVLYATLNKLLR